MKKYIYTLFVGLLAAATMTSCSEEQGTDPGTDGKPAVVVYQYAPGEGYNADNDIRLRVAANQPTKEAYYLSELTADKKAFVENNGKEAYMNRVIENGTKLDEISGASTQDVILTGIIGDYTITVVAVNGGQKSAAETMFYGIKWNPLGTGTFTSTFFTNEDNSPASFPVEVAKADHAEWYKITEPYEEGKNLIIKMDGNNANIEQQNVLIDSRYGAVYIEGIGKLADNILTMNVSFNVSAGTFGDFVETLELPAE